MPIAIGVDIGGSHISSAAVDLENIKAIPGTYFNGVINSRASKKEVYEKWSTIINQSLKNLNPKEVLGIGMAMPGPFRYKKGIALFERNGKYESLHQACVPSELSHYLVKDLSLRFLNDASAFGVGSALLNKMGNKKKIIAITLGTGFGAAFLENNIPVVNEERVPEGGCLWDKAFLKGIADDYFSTRWFISRYEELSGQNNITGVKDLLVTEDFDASVLFEEFAENISSFMFPYLKTFDADILIMGGSISKSHHLFLPAVQEKWKANGLELPIVILENTEEAGIIGSSFLFNDFFWNKVEKVLPER